MQRIPEQRGAYSHLYKYCEEANSQTVSIMCVASSTKIRSETKASNGRLHPMSSIAQLPYKQLYSVNQLEVKAGHTNFQKMKMMESRSIMHEQLINERNEWVMRERFQKQIVLRTRDASALVVQRHYRGHFARRTVRPKNRLAYLKKVHPILRREIQDELQALAGKLNLKPISWLSLDARNLRSKFKENINASAALQLQCFIRTCLARRIFKIRVEIEERRVKTQAAQKLKNFFMRIKALKEFQGAQLKKKNLAAIRMQSHVRRYLAQTRVRNLRQIKPLVQRREDANIKMVRTFRRVLREKRELRGPLSS